MFMLNWVVNEHVLFAEEDLGNEKISFPEAAARPDQDCRKGNSAAFLRLRSLNVRLKPGGGPSFKGNCIK